MANFDPAMRRETWLFQELGKDVGNKPIYRRMGFNLVSYDGSPDMVIEPVSAAYGVDLTNPSVATIDNVTQDAGAVVGFQTFQARPYEVHAFGDPVAI